MSALSRATAWPELSFHEQLRRTWITESVLCSADTECGPVPSTVRRNCVDLYLGRELAVLPNVVIAAVGAKAHERMRRLFFPFLRVCSVVPPGATKSRCENRLRLSQQRFMSPPD